MKTITARILIAASALLVAANTLQAQAPNLINYQGRLSDISGNPLSGNRTIAVRIYDAPSGGNITYEETIGHVSVSKGAYSFSFGSAGNGVAAALTGSDYLALLIDGVEETTRTRLLAVPFAMKAKESEDTKALSESVALLGSGIVSLETQASSIALELDGIGSELDLMNAQVSSSNGNLTLLEQRTTTLETNLSLLSGNFSSLSTRTGTLESLMSPINGSVASFSSNLTNLGNQLAESRQSIAQIQALVAAMSEVLELGPPALPLGHPPEGMVAVRGGRLLSTSELGPASVPSFYIGRYEVWWWEWYRVRSWAVANGYQINPGDSRGGGHPVKNVNWYDVVKWCNARSEMEGLEPVYQLDGQVFKIGDQPPVAGDWWSYSPQERLSVTRNQSANGYRLPTAAEWEWAARGGVFSQSYAYSGGNDLNEVAWYFSNSGSENGQDTKPVGQKLANELGLYDMSGNVWEWCEDLNVWENSWSQPGETFLVYTRIVRGGSFTSGQYPTEPGTPIWDLDLNRSLDGRPESISQPSKSDLGFRIVYNVDP